MDDDPVKNPYISAVDVDNHAGSGASISSQVRVGQIITFAMIQGVIVITGIMLWLAWDGKANGAQGGADADQKNLFVYIGIGVAAAGLVAAFVANTTARRRAIERFRQSGTPEDAKASKHSSSSAAVNHLLSAAQTGTLIGQALLEGPAVINAIFLLLTGNMLHVVAVVVMLIGIAVQVPTVGNRQAMIEDGLR